MGHPLSLDLERLLSRESIIDETLRGAPHPELFPLIDRLLEIPSLEKSFLEQCLAEIESRNLVRSEALSRRLGAESPWRRHGPGLWLSARLLELRARDEEAIAAWSHWLEQREVGDRREGYLALARLHGRLNRPQEAYSHLRKAVTGSEDYGFLSGAAKQFARLLKKDAAPSVRTARIAVLSSTTTDLWVPLLRLACFRDRIGAEVYVAHFGNLQQEIRDPASGLYAFEPDFVIIATNWRDANLPPFSPDPQGDVARVVEEFRSLWESLLAHRSSRVIQHNFEVPAVDSYGHLGSSLPGGRARMLHEANLRLLDVAPGPVVVLDLDQIASEYGKRAWSNQSQWYLARQYPAVEALPLLVDHQVAMIRGALGLAKKVLALDLDNTLWGGVIGEDGLDGIKVGPPSPEGEAHRDLQRYALELKDRGIVLAVCSKNNEEDAKLPFLRHDAMVLKLDDIVVFRANWQDKVTNLREIAATLNLGLDSIVFLDDNPVERALVRGELPEVLVPEFGTDPVSILAALNRSLAFEAVSLSKEDLERHASYRQNGLRMELQRSSASVEEFLRSLKMRAEVGPLHDEVVTRVVQLIGKTNQFNLTSRRHSAAEVRAMMRSPLFWTQYFKLSDRFGDNGLVGLIIAKADPSHSVAWEIDTWLMSCRVIGRKMEELMLGELARAVADHDARYLRGVYVPSRKNQMVERLYPDLGFTSCQDTDSGSGATSYLLDLEERFPRGCGFIEVHRPFESGKGDGTEEDKD